jgi:hypothetical protein
MGFMINFKAETPQAKAVTAGSEVPGKLPHVAYA